MAPTSTKIGHGLAKALGIKLNYREYGNTNPANANLSRGESVFSVDSANTYVEEEPTSLEWIQEQIPSRQDAKDYFFSLFPFLNWILHYNLQWLVGDLVAGLFFHPAVVSIDSRLTGAVQALLSAR